MEQEIRVSHDGGDRYRIAIGEHEVIVDQPVSAGGADSGPTPTDLFVASLASCTAHYAGRFLARHGIDAAGLEVSATFESGGRPNRVSDVELRLVVPSLPEGEDDRLRAVVEHCTVKNSIAEPPSIELEISRHAGRVSADADAS
jgi:putative redox protein